MERIKGYIGGILLSFAFAWVAMRLGEKLPLIGSAVLAILFGILYRNILGVQERDKEGLKLVGKKFLQYAIIFLGFSMSFADITKTGTESLWITLVTIAVSFATALVVGKILGLSENLRLLIGFGTAICGGSAIAAASPIVEAEENEIALSISTIFLFNLVAVFLFPFLGKAMNMSDAMFGLWAGTAINDTSSVVAAGYSFSDDAGGIATIVKLTRALMIVPGCLIMASIRVYKRKKSKQKISIKKIIPWFILWFMLASAASSTGFFPQEGVPITKMLSKWLMAMALFGIGTQVSFRNFVKAGMGPIATGLAAWLAVAIGSLAMQSLLY